MSDDAKNSHGSGEAHAEGGGGHAKSHGGSGHGAHGGGHEEAHEGAPEWLISFADNVALLMGFFVILLAMNMAKPTSGGIGGEGKYPSETPTERMEDFAIAVRAAFNNPVSIDSPDPLDAALVKRLKERQRKGETSAAGPDGDQHNVQAPRPSDFVNVTGFITFQDSTSDITDDASRTLQSVAEQVRGHTFMIEIRGHVSAAEARHDKEQAMRLANDRALAAAKVLVQNGVQWDQLRIVACADNERATPRANDREGHRNNQRAEVVVTQEQMPPSPYGQPSLTP